MFDYRDRLSLIIEALEGGKKVSEYARETGVSHQRIHQILKKTRLIVKDSKVGEPENVFIDVVSGAENHSR